MQTPRLVLLTVGEFGARVAGRLADRYPGSETFDVTTGTPHLAMWPALDALVVAADHDYVDLIELVERAAFAWRRPWLPILLEQAQLRVGPAVVPRRTACHACFRRRRRQHARNPQVWADIPGPAVAGSSPKVTGYADHHVGLAYGLAVRAIADLTDPTDEAPGGWVRTVNLIDGAVSRAGVVAVDGCGRCRDAAERQQRPAKLAAALQSALATATTGGVHG